MAGDQLSSDEKFQSIADDTLAKVYKELNRVKDDPRYLLLITHGMVELFITTILMKRCRRAKRMKENGREFGHSAKMLVLNELGILSDQTYEVLDWLRVLRNKSAHHALFTLTPSDLNNIENPEHRKVENFFHLCCDIIGDLWGAHVVDLAPDFAPALHAFLEPIIMKSHGLAIPEATDPPVKRLPPPTIKPFSPTVRMRRQGK